MVKIIFKKKTIRRYDDDFLQTEDYVDMVTIILKQKTIQQKFWATNGAHLASPIRGELGYAHWPQLGSQIYCPIGNQIWGPLGKQGVCPIFVLTVGKFVFSNSGNFRAKANPPKPRSCPKRPFGQ